MTTLDEAPPGVLVARLVPIGGGGRNLNGHTTVFTDTAFLAATLSSRARRVPLLDRHQDGLVLGRGLRFGVQRGWLVGIFETDCEPLCWSVRAGVAPGLSISYVPLKSTRRGIVEFVERAELLHVALTNQPAVEDGRFCGVDWDPPDHRGSWSWGRSLGLGEAARQWNQETTEAYVRERGPDGTLTTDPGLSYVVSVGR